MTASTGQPEIHLHLTIQPGTTLNVSVADGTIQLGAANGTGTVSAEVTDEIEAAIARLEASGASPHVRAAVDGLIALGFELRLPRTHIRGKRAENYLRVMDPGRRDHGAGYLTPSCFRFTRGEDRNRLAALAGARPVTGYVWFSHVPGVEEGLAAARLTKK